MCWVARKSESYRDRATTSSGLVINYISPDRISHSSYCLSLKGLIYDIYFPSRGTKGYVDCPVRKKWLLIVFDLEVPGEGEIREYRMVLLTSQEEGAVCQVGDTNCKHTNKYNYYYSISTLPHMAGTDRSETTSITGEDRATLVRGRSWRPGRVVSIICWLQVRGGYCSPQRLDIL